MLISAPECANNSAIVIMDIGKISKAFATEIPDEAKGLFNEKAIAAFAAKFNADGSIAFSIRGTHKDAASAQNSLQLYNAQIAELQNNPMAAAFIGKLSAKVQGSDLLISGKLTAEDIQMIVGQVMMMAATSQAVPAAAEAPAAPAAPAAK